MKLLLTSLFLLATAALAGEPPKPIGPAVIVTLQSGQSQQGQLLSFEKGQLSLKPASGSIVTSDGTQVVSVKFIPEPQKPVPPPKQPSAQETALSEAERRKLLELRSLAKRPSVEDELEFKRLQAKLDIHIAALEREVLSA